MSVFGVCDNNCKRSMLSSTTTHSHKRVVYVCVQMSADCVYVCDCVCACNYRSLASYVVSNEMILGDK